MRPLTPSLAARTDVYFRGYDNNYPDVWRFNEWKREFDQFVASGKLPNLRWSASATTTWATSRPRWAASTRRRPSRRTTTWRSGASFEAVAHSPYAADTLVIVTEDDCQDGPDHVDSHRATAYVVGPYVKQGAVVSTHYSQVNVLRTIEDILGTQHINLNTAFQRPMADVFDTHSSGAWTYTASLDRAGDDDAVGRCSHGGMRARAGRQAET